MYGNIEKLHIIVIFRDEYLRIRSKTFKSLKFAIFGSRLHGTTTHNVFM